MKDINLISSLIFIICLCSCNNDTDIEDNDAAMEVCVKQIDISSSPVEEGPDLLTLVLLSNNDKLNSVLDSAQVEELIFRKNDLSDDEDVTHGVRVNKISEGIYKINYPTSYFIDYPIDTTQEVGSDFIKTARVLITSKQGEQWDIKTCK